jgi:hypothetical protein
MTGLDRPWGFQEVDAGLDNTNGIMTARAGRQRGGGPIDGGTDLSLHRRTQTVSEAHPSSRTVRTEGSYPGAKR